MAEPEPQTPESVPRKIDPELETPESVRRKIESEPETPESVQRKIDPEPETPESVRRKIESEREQLAHAVDSLRDATKVSVNVPVVAAAAFGAGFFLAGGIGATVRLIFRRGREVR
jgi:hypothetical protein